jgi:hypothetical protein
VWWPAGSVVNTLLGPERTTVVVLLSALDAVRLPWVGGVWWLGLPGVAWVANCRWSAGAAGVVSVGSAGGCRRWGCGWLFVEICIVDASIFVVKLSRADGGCLGTRSR